MLMVLRRPIKLILVVGTGGVVLARGSFAYIDPNTGGMLFQLLAVLFASLTGILLFFSRHIKVTIARLKRRVRNSSDPASPETASGLATEE